MKFNDLINKGKNIFSNSLNSIKETADEKKIGALNYDLLVTKSNHIANMMPYIDNNTNPQEGKEISILSLSNALTVEKSKLINKLIPIDETPVNIKVILESKTQMEYWLIVTDKKLWIANGTEYKNIPFEAITKLEIINKGLNKIYVNLNEMAFVFYSNESEFNIFYEIIKNYDKRVLETSNAKAYLCGIIPKEQYINEFFAGFTIGNENQIVFHNGKGNNYLASTNNITKIEFLMDDMVIMTRAKKLTNEMINMQNFCRKMSIKITFNDNYYVFDILPPSKLNQLYKKEDVIYQKNYKFGKTVMDSLLKNLNFS